MADIGMVAGLLIFAIGVLFGAGCVWVAFATIWAVDRQGPRAECLDMPTTAPRVTCVLENPHGRVESIRTMAGAAPLTLSRPCGTYTRVYEESPNRWVYRLGA